MLLGISGDHEWENDELPIEPGDTRVLYTGDPERFGLERLLAVLDAAPSELQRAPASADIQDMSVPPPSSVPPGAGLRETVIAIESGRRRHAALRLSPLGLVLEHERALVEPLKLPLGMLQIGLIERGAARAGALEGRFPVLRRLTATAVIPREQGVEGWLWTKAGGSALTTLGDEDEAPNAALLFTKPLSGEAIAQAFKPALVEEIAARSPLGAPAVYGVLFRVQDPLKAENTFRQYGLLKPLTDREVPPTLRRSLPTDRPPDPMIKAEAPARAATSVAPPGMG